MIIFNFSLVLSFFGSVFLSKWLFRSKRKKNISFFPLKVKKIINTYYSSRFYCYCQVKNYSRVSPTKVSSLFARYYRPRRQFSLVGCGLGYSYVNKLIYPTYIDKSSSSFCFSLVKEPIVHFYHDYLDIIQDLHRDTSAGYSYSRSYKRHSCSQMFFYFLNINFPLFSVISMQEKKELLDIEKVVRKTRLFSIVEYHVEFCMRILFRCAYIYCLHNNFRPWKIGFSIYHNELSKMFYQQDISSFIGLDGNAFDTSLSLNLLIKGLVLMLRFSQYNSYEITLCVLFFITFIQQPRVFQGMIFSVNGAMPSGVFLTALLNSFCCLYVYLYSLVGDEFFISFNFFNVSTYYFSTYGDDVYIDSACAKDFVSSAKFFGLDYKLTHSKNFLSMQPICYKNIIIAKPKNISTFFDSLWFMGGLSTPRYISTLISLFSYYLYYFLISKKRVYHFVKVCYIFMRVFCTDFFSSVNNCFFCLQLAQKSCC